MTFYRAIRFIEFFLLVGILFFVGRILFAQPNLLLPEPDAGFWPANTVYLPCPIARPYLKGTDNDGIVGYMKYDATGTRQSPQVDGTRIGQGGAQHTVQVYLDGMIIGLCSGLACGNVSGPREMMPAPWRDVVIPNYGGMMLCQYWRNQALPGATLEACPFPRTPEQYANRVTGSTEWQSGWPLQAPNRTAWCTGPIQTVTRTPTRTQTPVPPTPTPSGPDPAALYIEALFFSGITAGCGNGNFCPDRPMTRREVAVWLTKAMGLDLGTCKHVFADVPCE